MVDYSKWKDIEVSDDEDETHPNIDTPSLFRWRHQARLEKMADLEQEKKQVEEKKVQLQEKVKEKSIGEDMTRLALDVDDDNIEELRKNIQQKEEEVKKKERLMPWNVDTISKEGWSKTVLNKPQPRADRSLLSEEERDELYRKFVTENEANVKKFGLLGKWEDCRLFLLEHPHLCCDDTANYLALWCLNLAMEEKYTLMEHVAKQVIAMQYILELAKQLDCDPRSCISGFFQRIQKVDKEYQTAFEDELNSFKTRIRDRAKVKLEKMMKEMEEEERKERLGPGGVDPVEVFEELPKSMKECFEKRDIGLLQQIISEMDEEQARYLMKRCVDSGLWIPDAKTLRDHGMAEAGDEEAKQGEVTAEKAVPTEGQS